MSRVIDSAWFPNRQQAEKYAREAKKDRKKRVVIYPAGDYRGAGWNVRIEEAGEKQ